MANALESFVYRYPQLGLPVRAGESQSEEYRNIVQYGILPDGPVCPFPGSNADRLVVIDTPAGCIEVLYLEKRADYIRFIQTFSGKCEPIAVPASNGAMTYFNLSNWRKINQHKAEYLAAGGDDWTAEFKRFTAVPENFKDLVVVVSQGYYSALESGAAGYEPNEWRERSLSLRIYHECAHIVSRKLWPENKEAIRDEIVADSVGIIAALGVYDDTLALAVLGIEKDTYREGGRLQNYLQDGQSIGDCADRTRRIVATLKAAWDSHPAAPFDFLRYVEENRLAIL
jgi:hypothetical protein